MYLCLASDGSVNVDFGPSGCRCCQRHCEAEVCDTKHDDHLCPEHANHSKQPGSLLASDRDCECSHIQIVQQQGPMVVQKSVKQSEHLVWVPAQPIAVLQTQHQRHCQRSCFKPNFVSRFQRQCPSASGFCRAAVLIRS